MNEATIANFIDNVRTLADRDGTIELRAEGDTAGVGTTYKTRVLEVSQDGEMLVDVPNAQDADDQLYRGTEVSILAVKHTRRLVGYCSVLGVEKYELAGGQRTRALRISRPNVVESAQRRRFFRVNAGGAVTHPVELFLLDPGGATRNLIERKPLKAQLLNIGGGGLGVTIDHASTLGQTLRRTTCFLASVDLPGEDEPLQIATRLVHVQAIHGDTLYLGFEFTYLDGAEQRRVEDQVVRVTTLLQRQQIRRQRGA